MASKFNLLNIAKTKDLFSCFVSDEGRKLVYLDFSSLEPRVAAHLTQDKNLLKIYGPNAKPNDVYLFTGANMGFASQQVRQYYDPDNPTKEAIKLAKSKLSDLRALLKEAYLLLQYGGYPKRLQQALVLSGYDVSLFDCKGMWEDFHHTYPGLKRLENKLRKMWNETGGWIINGRGRPIAVHHDPVNRGKDKLKDINNTVFQSTGHDILMSYLVDLNLHRHQRKVDMRPFMFDYHDATCWEVADSHVAAATAIYKDSLKLLNDRLKWTVEITGDVKVGTSMADFLED